MLLPAAPQDGLPAGHRDLAFRLLAADTSRATAIDGTKLKANASRHKALSNERMKQAEVQLEAHPPGGGSGAVR